MGVLDFFFRKPNVPEMVRLPSGSFTVDREGEIIASTLPQNFPINMVREISREVLHAFRSAETIQMPLNELLIDYSVLRIRARTLRGGAIIFLAPREANRNKTS
jgi:hypothetical protein